MFFYGLPIAHLLPNIDNVTGEHIFKASLDRYGLYGAMINLQAFTERVFKTGIAAEDNEAVLKVVLRLAAYSLNPAIDNTNPFEQTYQGVMQLTLAHGRARFGSGWNLDFGAANLPGPALNPAQGSETEDAPADEARPIRLTEDEEANGVTLTAPYTKEQFVRYVVRQKKVANLSYDQIADDIEMITGKRRHTATLRGDYRDGTLEKKARVRAPEWKPLDIMILDLAVKEVGQRDEDFKWRDVVAVMKEQLCSYPFSAVACSRKWAEMQSEEGRWEELEALV